MSTPKAEALRMIEKMADDVDWNHIGYWVYLRASVEQAMADCDAGLGISHEEMKKEMASWRASNGLRSPVVPSEPITTTSPLSPS